MNHDEGDLMSDRSRRRLAVSPLAGLLLGAATFGLAAQGGEATGKKSVYGKLERVDKSLNGVFMRSDEGKRLAWRFDRPVVEAIDESQKPGDPMIVIYRQISSNEKRVTAIAFPGSAETPTYVNLTGSRVLLRSAPMVDGSCASPNPDQVQESIIPAGGRADTSEACWCCATTDQTCLPTNKTGLGRALLAACFE